MAFIKKNQKLAIFVKMLISSNINTFSGSHSIKLFILFSVSV